MNDPALQPVFYTMDALQMKREVASPAFIALLEKGYTIGTVIMLAEEVGGIDRHTVGLIMVPPGLVRVAVPPPALPEELLALPAAAARAARRAGWLAGGALVLLAAILVTLALSAS